MRVIALEEHFTTELHHNNVVPEEPNPRYMRKEWQKGRGDQLGFDITAELFDIGDHRIAGMDRAGIDVQVLSLTTPGCQPLEPELAKSVARDANDRLFAAVQKYPERFKAFAALPTPDPKAATEEFQRCIKQLGCVGAIINGHTRAEYLDDKKYWPIFEMAQSLDVPIYLHPGAPPPAVMQTYYKGFEELARPAWGFAVETGTHFLRILFSGVFDNFPRLKIILGHLGEGLPFGLDRLCDHTVVMARNRKLKRPVKEYFRDNLVVTTSGNFSIPALLCTVQVLGIDNVLFSVDFPYQDNMSGRTFLNTLPLSDSDIEKITHKNAERVLRL